MKQSLNILHVEDSQEDSELIGHLLESSGVSSKITRVETRPQLFDELEKGSYDLILSDCKLPTFSGIDALEIAHALKPEIPFVFVSGTIGEEAAIESLRNGATDYVLKDCLARLVPAVRRALSEAEEQALTRHLQLRLREAGRMEAIGTLCNGIAHDFNNILTVIMGNASLLTIETDHPERILEISRTITEATRRATDIVRQLAAFTAKQDNKIEPISLNRFLQDNLGPLKEKVPASIAVSFDPGTDLPKVLATPSQLDHILRNLLANSVESMPNGGRITLTTQLVSHKELPDLKADLTDDNYGCLKVTDTGRGMDAAIRNRIFEPFYTTKERSRATGLGLSVVYGLMRAQNGSIDVTSEPGRGTTISLFFPLPERTASERPALIIGPDSSLRGSETILAIDDEPEVCFFLENVLQGNGYHVLTAHNADEAEKLFQQHRDQIQLIFSDIGLPKTDGITLCTKLKQLKPGLPVILASGYFPEQFKARINEFGCEAFLAKPFQPQDILQCVRKVLNGAETAAA